MNRATNHIPIWATLVVLAVVGLALRPMSTESAVVPTVTVADPTQGQAEGLVIGRGQAGGFSLFGLQFGAATRTVAVQIEARAGCLDRLALGDAWPVPYEECTSPVPVAGTVSGGGLAPTGESVIVIEVIVDEDCHRSIGRGDRWPPVGGSCP